MVTPVRTQTENVAQRQRTNVNATADTQAAERPEVRLQTQRQEVQSADEGVNEPREQRQLADVVSRSADGDTTQASETSRELLREEDELGRVYVKSGQPQEVTGNALFTEEEIGAANAANGENEGQGMNAAQLRNEVARARMQEVVEEAKEAAQEASEKRAEVLEETRERAETQQEAVENTARETRRTADAGEAADERGERIRASREQRADEEANPQASAEEITSFTGYTDTQLEQMYVKGEISKADYDQEMESREEAEEAISENGRRFSEEMGNNVNRLAQGERTEEAMEAAYAPDASQTLEAADRMKIVQAMEQLNTGSATQGSFNLSNA